LSKSKRKVPGWIDEFRKRTRLIEAIAAAYEDDCDCRVCQLLREIGEDLGEVVMRGGGRS